jgi:hypothetical protein
MIPWKERSRAFKAWVIVGSVVASLIILFGLGFLYLLHQLFGSSDVEPVVYACDCARLAYPPPGRIIFKENAASYFAGSAAFHFTAPRKDIEQWLKHSKGINTRFSYQYSPDHFLVMRPISDQEDDTMMNDIKPDYHRFQIGIGPENGIERDPKARYDLADTDEVFPWFNATIKHGTCYQIPQDSHANYGAVYIDWDTNRVWVIGSHS